MFEVEEMCSRRRSNEFRCQARCRSVVDVFPIGMQAYYDEFAQFCVVGVQQLQVTTIFEMAIEIGTTLGVAS